MSDLYSSSSPSLSDDSRITHQLYNPYEGLHDPRAAPIHRLIYDLPTSPEVLFDNEPSIGGRSWGYELCLFSGIAYLSGAVAGGTRGAVAGFRAAERGESAKLRLNRVLNSSGLAGKRLGNSLGVIGLMFSGLNSGINGFTGNEGVLNTVAAGLSTGILYKSASGPRSVAVAGAIGGIAAGLVVAGKQVVKRYVPI